MPLLGPRHEQPYIACQQISGQNANPSNTSQRGFTQLLLCGGWLCYVSPPLTLCSCGTSPNRQCHCWSQMEKWYIIAGLLSNFFSLQPLLFSSLSFLSPRAPSQVPLSLLISPLSPHISIICLFSPARGWRGWGAAWRAPSGCWRLSSCPACSPPAPLWRWDKTPASRLATVETWTDRETQKSVTDCAKYESKAACTDWWDTEKQWWPLAPLTLDTWAPGRLMLTS